MPITKPGHVRQRIRDCALHDVLNFLIPAGVACDVSVALHVVRCEVIGVEVTIATLGYEIQTCVVGVAEQNRWRFVMCLRTADINVVRWICC